MIFYNSVYQYILEINDKYRKRNRVPSIPPLVAKERADLACSFLFYTFKFHRQATLHSPNRIKQ